LTILDAIVLGLVEGITEFLPVSSTGHLILAAHALGLDGPERKGAIDAFNIVLQGGAILAVASIYWPRVRQMIMGVLGRDNAGFMLLVKLSVAFAPAMVLGLLLDKALKKYLFFPVPVIAAVILGGVFMLVLEQWRRGKFGDPDVLHAKRTLDDLSLGQAFFIGLLQCIAMWPGTSRSMMGIAGGIFVGLKPKDAAEFAFLLGLPTLGGATVYQFIKNMRGPESENMFRVFDAAPIVVGLIVSFVSAFLAVRWLVGFLNKHGLSVFGWYRLALGAALIVAAWQGWIRIGG
jgi:undecaprenyl-diphosphatase